MMMCPTRANEGLVSALMNVVDCHVRVFVHEAYGDLVGPNTIFATALTGLLTIYIALLGYQLLIGRGGLRVTELPLLALKIGLVLAFVTSWAAYQIVIFNLLFDGPREVMAALLAPLARMGSPVDGDIYAGLERTYAELARAATFYGAHAQPSANILQGGPMLGAGVLWLSGLGMLLFTAGLILAAKIILALLLALGPIFFALYLFEPTRPLFQSWLRTTLGFSIVPLSINIFGAAMLLMLDPFITRLQALVSNNQFDMSLIITIALIVSVFAIITTIAMRVGVTIVAGSNGAGRPGAFTSENTSSHQSSRTSAEPARSAAPAEPASARIVSPTISPPSRLREEAGLSSPLRALPASQRLGQSLRHMASPKQRALLVGQSKSLKIESR